MPSPTPLPAELAPVEPQRLAVMLGETLELWKLPANWADIAPLYREALEDVPADLLELAFKHAIKTCKFFPTPSELRAPIERLLAERQRIWREAQARAAHVAEQTAPSPIGEFEREIDRPTIERAMQEVEEAIPKREPPPTFRSTSERAELRRSLLRAAFDRHLAAQTAPVADPQHSEKNAGDEPDATR